MKILLTYQEAKELHSEFYDEDADYSIMQMQRSGPLDFPPFSWQHGLSDIGSWFANISSDGTNFVITKEGWLNADQIKGCWQFSVNDIKQVKCGIFKWRIKFNSRVSELGKEIALRPRNDYGTREEFKQILEKL